MSYLGELAEIVKAVVELLKTSKPEAVAVVVAGSVVLGTFLAGFVLSLLGWLKGSPPTPVQAPQPDPEPLKCPARHIAPDEAATIERLAAVLDALEKPESELWQLNKAQVPHDLLNKIHNSSMRVVTFTNLKGGVGKTTLAANIAAYLSQPDEVADRHQGYRVLLIDFDYQGNLSSTVWSAAKRQGEFESEADRLLNGRLAAADLVAASRRLGPVMPNLSLVPATFELGRQENRLLIRHLLQPGETDPRFALVRLLSSDAVLAAFKLVIIDTPPRPTIGTIAALCASTHAIIPTILDKGSTDNVGGVIAMMDRLFRKDLNPHIKFAGIVGTKTQAQRLDATERRSRFDAERVAQARWGSRAGGIEAIAVLEEWPDDGYVLQKNVPDTARFHADAGHTIAYLDERQPNAVTRAHIAELGRQIARRIGL